MIAEYGPGLQGDLLNVVHGICEHQLTYATDVPPRYVSWERGDVRLCEAYLTATPGGLRVVRALLSADRGGMTMRLQAFGEEEAIADGDPFAADFLETFRDSFGEHLQAEEHELCLQALVQKRCEQEAAQRAHARRRLPRFRLRR